MDGLLRWVWCNSVEPGLSVLLPAESADDHWHLTNECRRYKVLFSELIEMDCCHGEHTQSLLLWLDLAPLSIRRGKNPATRSQHSMPFGVYNWHRLHMPAENNGQNNCDVTFTKQWSTALCGHKSCQHVSRHCYEWAAFLHYWGCSQAVSQIYAIN